MSPRAQGISRQGLDAAFAADEAFKSNLLLEAKLLREQGQDEAAAARFAQAAACEERLAERCAAQGLADKAHVHRFSAARCWAQAGNFYQAIASCDALLAETSLPEGLRRRIRDYRQVLRSRRAKWYTDLLREMAGAEG